MNQKYLVISPDRRTVMTVSAEGLMSINEIASFTYSREGQILKVHGQLDERKGLLIPSDDLPWLIGEPLIYPMQDIKRVINGCVT